MGKAKMQHCFNCGAELGVYESPHYRDLQVCGQPKCLRAERDQYRYERDEAIMRAEEDDYGLYS